MSPPKSCGNLNNRNSYHQILKSSAIIGGSSLISIVLGIVRNKVLALLLGPGGLGMIGVFNSLLEIAKNIATMGLNNSGVRQIAEAVGTRDSVRIARTALTLRRTAFTLGLVGALLLLLVSTPVARLTFGGTSQAGQVALLSIAVFLGAVSAGQTALIQGVRRVSDLARMSIFSALLGTVVSIALVYLLREKGIVLFLIAVAATAALTSWWYARRIPISRVHITWKATAFEARGLMKLGFVFMSTSFMTFAAAYLIRVLVLRKLGTDAAGHYQASWILSGLYVSFILQAMGADFYPRLTAEVADFQKCNQTVNEQIEIALLLACPGILGTLTFAPLLIYLFFSTEFAPAIELLRWSCLGMLLRVASWPMGFILPAKGASTTFFFTELASNTIYMFLAAALLHFLGLYGVGVAFACLYFFHLALMFLVARRMTGFRWSHENRRIALIVAPVTLALFLATQFLPEKWVIASGSLASLCAVYLSLRRLCRILSLCRVPQPILNCLLFLRIAPTAPNA